LDVPDAFSYLANQDGMNLLPRLLLNNPKRPRNGIGANKNTRTGKDQTQTCQPNFLAVACCCALLQEGTTLCSKGFVEVSLPEDDSAAMLILMNMLQGRTRKVPRLVDLKALTQLAILVRNDQLYKAVEVFSDMLIDKLKGQLPELIQRILYDGFAFPGSFGSHMNLG
jgi:hypothetical protein